MKWSQFLQGNNGENSSKRLAGLATTLVMLILAIYGGLHFISNNNTQGFLSLIDTLSMFAAGTLVSGLAETLIKKKHDKNTPNNSGDSVNN